MKAPDILFKSGFSAYVLMVPVVVGVSAFGTGGLTERNVCATFGTVFAFASLSILIGTVWQFFCLAAKTDSRNVLDNFGLAFIASGFLTFCAFVGGCFEHTFFGYRLGLLFKVSFFSFIGLIVVALIGGILVATWTNSLTEFF